MKKVVIISTVAALLFIIVIISVLKGGKKGIEVETSKAAKRTISPTIEVEGEITPRVKVNISSQIIAEIKEVPVKEGERVKKGDVLVILDNRIFTQEVESSKAQLISARLAKSQAETNLELTRKEYHKKDALSKNGLISSFEFDTTEANLKKEEASLKIASQNVLQAEASLQKAQDSLSKTVINAPMDGTITDILVKPGEQALTGTLNNAGTVIMVLSDLSEIIAEGSIDEADISGIAVAQKAKIKIESIKDKEYAGLLDEVGTTARASTKGQQGIKQFRCKVKITNPDSSLHPGMTATISLFKGAAENVIAVPTGAIIESKEGKDINVFAYEKGKAKKRAVKTGTSDDEYTQIKDGIQDDEEIITGPARILRFLKDGDLVRIKKAVKQENAH